MPRQPMRSPDKEVPGTDGRIADAEGEQGVFGE
jgi:hypothetical protein